MSAIIRQATCVAIGGRALLIEGEPGSGKSSLALALIDRGAVLVGDDAVTLELRGDRVHASPPPNIAGRLEIRNVGLVTLPVTEALVALLVTLDEAAPRQPDPAASTDLLGCKVPHLALYPGAAALTLRAEYALRERGIA